MWDEATVDRELSLLPEDESEDEDEVEQAPPLPTFDLPSPEPASTSTHVDTPEAQAQPEVEDERDDSAESGDESESEPLDAGVIKITSDDPLAAARAAAILRLVRPALSPPFLTEMLTLLRSTTTTASRTSPRRTRPRRGAGAPPWTRPPRCATRAGGRPSRPGSARPLRRRRTARGRGDIPSEA